MTILHEMFLQIRGWPWSEVKSIAELVLYYLAVVAALGALLRLNTILRVIIEFNKGRGPLWELKNTVEDIKRLEPSIKALRTDFEAISSKVDTTNKQLAELQVESIGTRIDAPLEAISHPVGDEFSPTVPDVEPESDAENWNKLRDAWRRNAERLEYVIDAIRDGRTKSAYDRLPRTNLTRIVNKLQGQNIISSAAANASRQLIDLFNSYRPRNRPVPDEVAGPLEVLEKLLDRELLPYAAILAAQEAEDLRAVPPNSPPQPSAVDQIARPPQDQPIRPS